MYYLQLKLTRAQLKKLKRIYKHGDKYAGYIRISKKQLDFDNLDNHKAPDMLKITREELAKINSYNRKLPKNKTGFDIWINKERLLEQQPYNNGGNFTIDKLLNTIDDEKHHSKEYINNEIKKILFPIHSLSNFDIEAYAKLLKINIDVLAKDKVRKPPRQNQAYIINLDDSGSSGTHWVGLLKSKNKNEGGATLYYDSYGVEYPPQSVIDLGIKNLLANDSTHQYLGDNSILCGYYCLKIIKSVIVDGMSYDESLDQFEELNDIYTKDLENMDIADNLFL